MQEILQLNPAADEDGGILRVAVPIRHMSLFDYWCDSLKHAPVGCRVRIPFGNGSRIGIVVEHAEKSHLSDEKIRPIQAVLEDEPAISTDLLRTLQWTSQYYHQAFGEVLWTALPKAVRIGSDLQPNLEMGYQLTESGIELDEKKLSRARVQKAIIELLKASSAPLGREQLKATGPSWQSALRQLMSKQLVLSAPLSVSDNHQVSNLIQDLTRDQATARDRIVEALDCYRCFLIHGVTGSGKTEVYLHAISQVIQNAGQALMLVPEIGLTPQLEQRVNSALGITVSCFHSGMTDAQRHRTWWLARTGEAKVIIGTRSAVFLPFQNLAMIVIDEEHDTSFKQQERVRYHARAVAIHRAASRNFPVIFGTATPSLETVYASRTDRVETLTLPERATKIQMPSVSLIDLNMSITKHGVAVKMFREIDNRIRRGEQSLIFINRRGFAPVVICLDCKWVAKCTNCDVNLIFHSSDQRLHCHHCQARSQIVQQCPDCMSDRVNLMGEGTQRIEQVLHSELPGARVIRIDRDTTRSYKEFERQLERIQKGKVDVLIGTQMLSKGHHFPDVTLVCILNVDYGFYSMDFRATEHMVQQVLQVAGRAGRVEIPGKVLIQTIFPDSEIFGSLIKHDYLEFAESELEQRHEANQPPYSHYALLRANSLNIGEELVFLRKAHSDALNILQRHDYPGIRVFDIVQSPIKKISNRHRAQLLTAGETPNSLKRFLGAWMAKLDKIPKKGQLRWNLDVDPVDFL